MKNNKKVLNTEQQELLKNCIDVIIVNVKELTNSIKEFDGVKIKEDLLYKKYKENK